MENSRILRLVVTAGLLLLVRHAGMAAEPAADARGRARPTATSAPAPRGRYACGVPVALRGRLRDDIAIRTVDHRTDKPIVVHPLLLVLPSPIGVVEPDQPPDGAEPKIIPVERMQLIPQEEHLSRFPSLVNRSEDVLLFGTLLPADTGYHRTPYMFSIELVARAADLKSNIGDDELANVVCFVRRFVTEGARDHPGAASEFFAEVVDHYGKRRTPAQIDDEDRKHQARWPQRRYTLTGVERVERTAAGLIAVRYALSYELSVAAGGKRRQGTSNCEMHVQPREDGFRIIVFRESTGGGR